ncbi:MAG: glucose-6-phosphate isomerase [Gemmataceae bacterium]|nr:glucose-6-phosphate isomerase [Gemmataceae bacterium]
MQLPDEAITYDYHGLLIPTREEWTPAAELRQQHFLSPAKIKDLLPRLNQVRSQVAAERELRLVPPELEPVHAGFIDLPQKLLDQERKAGPRSLLGRIQATAQQFREQVDRVVILGIGGSYLGARALFDALKHTYHNELPPKDRSGVPRIYFEGNNVDNDALHDLFELLQLTCVDPETREERWGVVVISKSGETLETAAAFRAIRREMAEFYGSHSPRLKQLLLPITGFGKPAKEGKPAEPSKLRQLSLADGFSDEEIFPIPDDVGGRYSVFTAVGLVPAALMGLDVRALLLGAAAMTRRFLDEPFERNPVLQYAAVNYLMTTQCHKPIRVLSIWSKKLEALGWWYDQLLAESLGKEGLGATPLTAVGTRDLHSRGQQHQEGARDKVINNLIVKSPRHPPIMIGMADKNQDDLNQYNRKGLPDLLAAALRGTNQAYADAVRPTADLVMPMLSEHAMGQLMQMLMLATVVEGRLLGVNPYGQPGVEAYKRNMKALLKS